MTSNNPEQFENQVVERLRALKDTPARNEQKAAMGRSRFLAEATGLAKQQGGKPIVSSSLPLRLKVWFDQVSSPFRRKERYSMVTVLTSLVVVFSLLFGGAGVTVYAAQESMPDDALYGVKLLSENVSLGLSGSTEEKIDLLLEYADRRSEEILAFARQNAEQNAGELTENTMGPLTRRYQEQVFYALELASQLPDAEMQIALAEIGVHIRKHDRDQVMGRTKAPEDVEPAMEQLEAVRRLQIGLSELGITDPLAFRYQLRMAREQVESGALLDSTEPAEVVSDTIDCPGCGLQVGPGPGPGPQNQGEVTQPDDGYGPYGPFGTQEGDGNSYGPGPQNEGEVTQPDAGYGPSTGPGPQNQGETQQPAKQKPAESPEPSGSGGSKKNP
jgi:hypothetical protein